MNFCTPKLLFHLKLAGKCYGPVLPLMGDGVQKIVVHNDWIIMFWGFAHRRFVQKHRENRQTFVPVMLTLTPAESSEVVVAVKKDIVKAAKIAYDIDIGDALSTITITDPSPALRKGHYDFARLQEIDTEGNESYHCTDYSHVFRKITGSKIIKTPQNREYIKDAIECCHRAPTVNVAKMVAKVILTDLQNRGEQELVKYLIRKGTGFFNPDWFSWNIMSCRFRDDDGVTYLVATPPSSQAEESFFHSLKSRVLLSRYCSRDHLIASTIPELLIILSTEYVFQKIVEIPLQITTDQLGPAADFLNNPELYTVCVKTKPEDALYAGKFGVGTRVFVNRLKYAAYKVTLTRIKEYLKVLQRKKSLQSIIGTMTLQTFQERYLSLHCSTKEKVFVNGKVQVRILHKYVLFRLLSLIYFTSGNVGWRFQNVCISWSRYCNCCCITPGM